MVFPCEQQRLREHRRVRRRAQSFLEKPLCAKVFGNIAQPPDFPPALDEAVSHRIVQHVLHTLPPFGQQFLCLQRNRDLDPRASKNASASFLFKCISKTAT